MKIIKKIFITILISITTALGGVMFLSCSTFGTIPDVKDMSGIDKLSYYDKNQGNFMNRRPGLVEEEMKKNIGFSNMREWFKSREHGIPEELLPEVKPDMIEFNKASDEIKIIWFGHSSVLMNVSGKKILIDPVFSETASPFSFMVKRFQKPVLKLSELPEIDYIVISHDHYDHLDMETIKFFKDKNAEFIVPLGVGSHLRGWGIKSGKITELGWWDKTEKGGIDFIAAPAQHFSGRSLTQKNKTLWASWIIMSKTEKIFFSGDSGYDTHFSEIGKKYGPFDLAFIETGQYNEKWSTVHMLPHEAAQAYFDLEAKRYFPIHWGMFELALHSWFQPAYDIAKESDLRGINLITPLLGETITVTGKLKTGRWWESLSSVYSDIKDQELKLVLSPGRE